MTRPYGQVPIMQTQLGMFSFLHHWLGYRPSVLYVPRTSYRYIFCTRLLIWLWSVFVSLLGICTEYVLRNCSSFWPTRHSLPSFQKWGQNIGTVHHSRFFLILAPLSSLSSSFLVFFSAKRKHIISAFYRRSIFRMFGETSLTKFDFMRIP